MKQIRNFVSYYWTVDKNSQITRDTSTQFQKNLQSQTASEKKNTKNTIAQKAARKLLLKIGGRPAKSYESKSYLVNFNIVTGTSLK